MRIPPFLLAAALAISASAADQHLLYVASPGTRNYVEYGGAGILVFDIDNGYKFVRRIPTWTLPGLSQRRAEGRRHFIPRSHEPAPGRRARARDCAW